MHTIIDEFKRDGFITRPLGITEEVFLDSAGLFLSLLECLEEEDPAVVRRLQVKRGYENETPLGLSIKRGGMNERGEYEDGKRYIHVDRSGIFASDPFVELYAQKKDVLKRFLTGAAHLCEQFEVVALAVLEEVGRVYPMIPQKFIAAGTIPNLQIRFLAYDKRGDDEVIGNVHTDKSGITLTGFETAPGLFFVRDGIEVEAPKLDGVTYIMPGNLFARDTGCEIEALSHVVRQPKGRRVNEMVGRVSIVCFVDQILAPGVCIPSYQETHQTRFA